jgi:hypothetical protein
MGEQKGVDSWGCLFGRIFLTIFTLLLTPLLCISTYGFASLAIFPLAVLILIFCKNKVARELAGAAAIGSGGIFIAIVIGELFS